MLVGDFIYNDDFDVNCNVAVYDCTEEGVDWSNAPKIYEAYKSHSKPLDKILDMKIKYVTLDLDNKTIVIEATR